MKTKTLVAVLFALSGIVSVTGQSRYDDDIYYNASKDTKTKQENAAYKKAQAERKALEAERQRQAEQEVYEQLQKLYYGDYEPGRGGTDYQAAGDETIIGSGLNLDVDTYNRRGSSNGSVSKTDTVTSTDDFAYTRRIEKYHNGDIIAKTNDPELVEYYYSTQRPEINVYYVNEFPYSWNNWGWNPFYYPYNYPYYNGYWGWNYPYWGPSYAWHWGSPSYIWGWAHPHYGWGGWYPSWSWGYPGWISPGVTSAIASRYAPNGRRPTNAGVRNGYTGGVPHGQLSGNNVNRPTTSQTGSRYSFTPGQVGNYRPSTTRPSSTGNQGGNISPNHGTNNSYTTPSTTSGNRNGNRGYNSNTSRSYSPSYNSGASRGSGSWNTGSGSGGSRGMSGSGGGSARGGRR